MSIKKIGDLDFLLPDWIGWIEWKDFIIKKDKENIIIGACKQTLLVVEMLIDWNIIKEINCCSKKENWECINKNWPKDGKCNVDLN